MQDRFKFRVWHTPWGETEEPEMLYNAESAYDYMGEVPASSFGSVLNDESFEVMQCTGLKDKNGKLIYEGDIVKAYFTDDDFLKYDLMIVEWCKSSCAFVFKDYKFMNFEDFITTCFESESYEVVGNIYEDKIEQM